MRKLSLFSTVELSDLKVGDLVYYQEKPILSRRNELNSRFALAQVLFIASNGGIAIHHLNYVDNWGNPLSDYQEALLRVQRRPMFRRVVNNSDLMIRVMSNLSIFTQIQV